VPPSAPAALADRLAAFFREQPAREAAFAGIADRVLARLSWDGIAERHLEIYQRLTGGRPAA
jgi:glycosyltransferase involved in cell wall biosynthesis